jgi:hypothetical protein
LFEEGRRSVSVPPARKEEPVSRPIAPEPVAVEPVAAPPPSLGQEHKPACTEPWKSLYILRRGVFPCCYGGAPIAPMDQYREAWNGELVQAIRAELSAGRFHEYCLHSTACPIVRKSAQSHAMPARQRARFYLRRWWAHLDRVTYGGAGKVYRALRRGARAASNPRYVVHHIQRLRGRATGPYVPRDRA